MITVWIFENFSVIHILREINFDNLEVLKLPFLPFYVSLVNFWLQKVQKFKIQFVKMADFALLEFPKLISRKSE